ncbi:MAG: hypothetical protein MK212_12710 [Saprospiraceae bacterium]|nr:hypothetical protein [Saprospiraceae bacterium]
MTLRFLLSVIFLSSLVACSKYDYIPQEGDIKISFDRSDIKLRNNGNVKFVCTGTNTTDYPLPSLPIELIFSYSPDGNEGTYTIYEHTDLSYELSFPLLRVGRETHDDMEFYITDNCYNPTCSGYYKCQIIAYSPDDSNMIIDEESLEIQIDENGNLFK